METLPKFEQALTRKSSNAKVLHDRVRYDGSGSIRNDVAFLFRSGTDAHERCEPDRITWLQAQVFEPESPTVKARREFLTKVRCIAGIDVVESPGTLETKSITVVVPSYRSKAADAVYRLEAEMYRKYSGARLGISFEESE